MTAHDEILYEITSGQTDLDSLDEKHTVGNLERRTTSRFGPTCVISAWVSETKIMAT